MRTIAKRALDTVVFDLGGVVLSTPKACTLTLFTLR
jgi:hypothetical protein